MSKFISFILKKDYTNNRLSFVVTKYNANNPYHGKAITINFISKKVNIVNAYSQCDISKDKFSFCLQG